MITLTEKEHPRPARSASRCFGRFLARLGPPSQTGSGGHIVICGVKKPTNRAAGQPRASIHAKHWFDASNPDRA